MILHCRIAKGNCSLKGEADFLTYMSENITLGKIKLRKL
jgi:hypothetical protein